MKKIIFLLFILLIPFVNSLNLTSSNIMYLSMDSTDVSGTTLIDLSSSGNNATTSGTTGQTGIINESVYLDGAGTENISQSTILDTVPNNFSISFWFKLNSTFDSSDVANMALLEKQNILNQDWIDVRLNQADGKIYFYTEVNNGGLTSASTTQTSWTGNQWYHIIITWDTIDGKRIYVNNSLDGSEAQTVLMNNGTSSDLTFGLKGSAGTFPAQVVFDEISIYNKSLNSSERSQLWNSGSGYNPYFSNVTDSITILTPKTNEIIQRNTSNKGTFNITGTYTGSPTNIEASFNNSAWQTIVTSPTGNSFNGQMINVTPGQGTLIVRFSNNNSINSSKNIGIGDLFILAGQSNSVMKGTNLNNQTTGGLTAYAYNPDGSSWFEANDPLFVSGAVSGYPLGSSYPAIADELMSNQSVPIGFIAVSQGGTAITEWEKNANSSASCSCVLYDRMVSTIQGAITGTNDEFKAVLWFQGENDANPSYGVNTEDAYKTALRGIIDDLKNDTYTNHVWLVGQIGSISISTYTKLNFIREAQRQMWNYTDVYEGLISYYISNAPDNLHWTTDAQISELAVQWIKKIKDAIYNEGDGTSPQINSSIINNNFLTISFNENLNTSISLSTSLFEVNNGVVSINSVYYSGNNKVVLNLSSSPNNGTFSIGKDQSGEGINVIKDLSNNSVAAVYNESFISATDTCTPPAINNNWTINMSDYCNITTQVQLGTGIITLIDSGTLNISNLVNASDLDINSTNSIIWLWNNGNLVLS